jgi:hypothetical protein
VTIENEKAAPIQSPPPTNYGNMPLQVSQSGQPANPEDPKQNKLEEGGKKFGKKLGNAGMSEIYLLRSPDSWFLIDHSNLWCRCHYGFQYREQHFLISYVAISLGY